MTLNRPTEIKNRPVRNGPAESLLVDELATALERVISKAQRGGQLAQQASETWLEGSEQWALHIGRAQAYQEILTNIESDGANSL